MAFDRLWIRGLGGWHRLPRVDERDRRGLCGGSFSALPFDLQVVARIRELDRHPHVPDAALEPRRPDEVRDLPDALAARQSWPSLSDLEVGRIARRFDPNEPAGYALLADPLERRLADIVALLRFDQPLKPHDLERVVLHREVGIAVEDASLDAPRLAGRDRPDPVGRSRHHDRFPQIVAAGRIGQVDLIPDLAGPPGAADDHGA